MVGGVGPPNSALLTAHAKWLSQGDIFLSAPILDAVCVGEECVPRVSTGPALLITHGCSLDKKTNAGAWTIRTFHFLPLRATSGLGDDKQTLLRQQADLVNPAEAFYLGDVPELTESHVLLSEPFSIPATHFRPSLKEFSLPDGKSETMLIANSNDSRLARLSDPHLAILRDKLNVYWTRRQPAES